MKTEIYTNKKGNYVYRWTNQVTPDREENWEIELLRYTDPQRKNLAESAATYLNKEDTDNVNRPINIMKKRHTLTIYRQETATFKFRNVPKQVYDHLVTYTLATRIAGGNRAIVAQDFVTPIDKTKDKENVVKHLQEALDKYHELAEKESPQVARCIMGANFTMAPFIFTFNFQNLIKDVFPQRLWVPGAQGLTYQVVKGMYELLKTQDKELWEEVYELYGTHRAEFDKAQSTLRKKQITVQDFVLLLKEEDHGKQLEEVIRKKFGELKSMWG